MTQQNTSVEVMSREMQLQLLEAFDRGEDEQVVRDWLVQYPQLQDDIISTTLAMRLFAGPDPEIDAETEAAIHDAVARSLAALGVASPSVALTLVQAMQQAKLTKVQVARRLSLGVEVLEKIFTGHVTIASIPQRFFERIGASLQVSWQQAQTLIATAAASDDRIVPAFNRADAIIPGTEMPPIATEDFITAVAASRNMSADEKAAWLVKE